MPPGNRTQVFPAFDHIPFHFLDGGEKRSRTATVGPQEWVNFLDETGIDWTVVSHGGIGGWGGSSRRIGRLPPAAPTIVTNVSSRIKGLALIPIQDTEAALQELRRAVKDLRMVGAMLPSNGEGIKGHFGSKIYWPIYEETEKFGCR